MKKSVPALRLAVMGIAISLFNHSAYAHSHEGQTGRQASMATMKDGAHGVFPVGVPGDNMQAGAYMVNYRPMFMHMEGTQIGSTDRSPEYIVSNVSNPHSPPSTLRVVPTKMDVQMHMLMAMYAPTNRLTLMAMTSYNQKKMSHITFAGGTGSSRLGTFTTESSGVGDTSVSAIYQLYDDGRNRVQLTAGLSLPTGSTRENDAVLAPTGASPTLRLPYAMQLGSGTYDFLPTVTWRRRAGPWTFATRYSGVIRVGR